MTLVTLIDNNGYQTCVLLTAEPWGASGVHAAEQGWPA